MAVGTGAVAHLVIDPAFWRQRDVLVTGHTGFKGGWLCLWLQQLGARVHGFALDPPASPNLFDLYGLGAGLASDTRADLADLPALRDCLAAARPSVVIHLAAQALVRESYKAPLDTFSTNVMGTANLLQVMREVPGIRAAVLATTDKVYANNGNGQAFGEDDALGGHDPYSASKAACEIVAASFRASFFGDGDATRIATARAGNVIGGGDWAGDRLVPDCLAAFAAGRPVSLRYPQATRPWQHVLEPLAAYLQLAQALCADDGAALAQAWNFGPEPADEASVGAVAQQLATLWGTGAAVILDSAGAHPHEAQRLRLDSRKAATRLGWRPRWPLAAALQATVQWQHAWLAGENLRELALQQIARYQDGCA